ncbi:hypothetical protein OEIGOIKO_04835 [Streptomyces chrestomyceticus JCM 4735]|uniref:Uncharacterized protein n=1 Tax=Streptomyces chrestomyceticus JCM 4735 TaxID=1306181 RepID=A0A7U9KYU8_9ACTN|nr:hypothetical protein [Streptomyces chrestomyceticus]GCD37053.1 hypothetical protein OEIGOIKO_04835 [Streptomyces chrestomyceticus JCM 4735]
MSTTPESRSEADAEPQESPARPETAETTASAANSERTPQSAAHAALIFDDPLSRRSSDDTDRGWGERPGSADSAADLARFLDEKPPHHL